MGLSRLRIKVGLAGWSNPPGKQALRKVGESHLEYYADQFPCVEVNSSFYRSHRPATYLGWRRATPRSFKFSIKFPKTVTHEGALRGVRRELKEFFIAIEPLGEKLGALLIQLPPSLAFEARVARAFFRQLPEFGKAFYACEPRHPSWFDAPADEMLQRNGVTRVAADPAKEAIAGTPGGSVEHAYYRWHGSPRMYYSSYPDARIEAWAAELLTRRPQPSWCIFDNTARHAAWDNAKQLCRRLELPAPVRATLSRR